MNPKAKVGLVNPLPTNARKPNAQHFAVTHGVAFANPPSSISWSLSGSGIGSAVLGFFSNRKESTLEFIANFTFSHIGEQQRHVVAGRCGTNWNETRTSGFRGMRAGASCE
jgi:hypothetical protein